MKARLERRWLVWSYWICRLVLGSVFIYAAVTKIESPREFADRLAAYQILPFTLINPLALGLPFFELACGLLVMTGFYFRVGALGMLGLLTVFMTGYSVALLRGLSIDCGCFGAHSWLDSNPWIVLLRDGIFLAAAGFLYGYHLRRNLKVPQ